MRRRIRSSRAVDPPSNRRPNRFLQALDLMQSLAENAPVHQAGPQQRAAELEVLRPPRRGLGDPEVVRLQAPGHDAARRCRLEANEAFAPPLRQHRRRFHDALRVVPERFVEPSPMEPSRRSAILPSGSWKNATSTSIDRVASSGRRPSSEACRAWLPITRISFTSSTAPAARTACSNAARVMPRSPPRRRRGRQRHAPPPKGCPRRASPGEARAHAGADR